MTTNHTTSSKQPSHFASHVRDSKSGKGFWTRVGSACANADGKGINAQLEVLPLDGRLTLRVPSESASE